MANIDPAPSNPGAVRHHSQHWPLKGTASSTTPLTLRDYRRTLVWHRLPPLFRRHYRGMNSRAVIGAKVPGGLDD